MLGARHVTVCILVHKRRRHRKWHGPRPRPGRAARGLVRHDGCTLVPDCVVIRRLRASSERPFSLLALDGGGEGKGDDPPVDPLVWLRPGGVVVMDDFTPATEWPPQFAGEPDHARLFWFEHPRCSRPRSPRSRGRAQWSLSDDLPEAVLPSPRALSRRRRRRASWHLPGGQQESTSPSNRSGPVLPRGRTSACPF